MFYQQLPVINKMIMIASIESMELSWDRGVVENIPIAILV